MTAGAAPVAVVTGASRGIGRAIALRLAASGRDCVVTYRRSAALARSAVGEIERLGRRGLALPLDLEDPSGVDAVIERVAETYGRIDVLVANAAATAFKPILEQRQHNIDLTFAISVDSFLAAIRASVPLMTAGCGRIVVVSGIDSHQAMAGHGLLGAAKAAMESLVRSLAVELGPRGITVNAVSPGFVATDSSRTYVERGLRQAPEEATARLVAATPARRLGTVGDVAALVAYVASEEAGFLTGQTIILDGGVSIVSPLSRLERA